MAKLMLLLALLGCGSTLTQGDFPVSISYTENPVLNKTIDESILFWNIGTNMEVFRAGDTGIKIDLVDYFPCGSSACSFNMGEDCHIEVNRPQVMSWALLAHEEGHCLGLKHQNEDHNIMNHNIGIGPWFISNYDLEKLGAR